jgi:hypothetical protein
MKQYFLLENIGLENFLMLDYRLKENRKRAFIEWCEWSLTNKDCDPALWLLNYLFDRFEHNIEQKYWISWIYGTTYHLPTAWIIWNEFPDFELVDQKRLQDWNDNNYARLRYQTDTKWNKGHLPQQFASYKRWIMHENKSQTQRERFANLLQRKSFEFIWGSVEKNLHKFGRYSTWYYLQTLKDCVGLNVVPNNLKLADYSGSRSHRNGLCFALGRDEWINQKLHVSCIEYLEQQAAQIQKELSVDMDLYQMETLLCSFKKVFRKKQGRYLGYYLDRQAEEIKKVEADGWSGVDWQVFWDARKEILQKKQYDSKTIRKNLFSVFLDTGNLKYGTL